MTNNSYVRLNFSSANFYLLFEYNTVNQNNYTSANISHIINKFVLYFFARSKKGAKSISQNVVEIKIIYFVNDEHVI